MTKPTASGMHRLETALSREKRLTEASVALHTSLDLDEVLAMILSAACEGVGADRGTVFLLSEDGSALWSRVLRGGERLEIRLPLGQGIAGSVAATGETVRVADAYADPRFDRSWDRASGYRTRQILCRPIRSRTGDVLGVFQLLNKQQGDFDEADESYLDALSVHASLALENARLHSSALEKERQDREIGLVQEVQRAYQPERARFDVPGLLTAGMNLLCEDASGDYYDVIELEDGALALAVGDVSGHGLKSALVMAQGRALLRAFLSTVQPLNAVIDRLDAGLARDMSAGTFMSLFVAVIDPPSGRVGWCNAGHPAALLSGDGDARDLGATGRILGIMPLPGHRAGTPFTLARGQTMLLYTDGATEARSPTGEMFGVERLQALVDLNAAEQPEALLDAVRAALLAWTGTDVLGDDLTLLAARRI